MPKRTTNFEYVGFNPSGNDMNPTCTGGAIVQFIAAGTLLTGDAVYCTSAENTVDKSGTTATLGYGFAGIVVGGQSLPDDGICLDASQTDPQLKTGLTAATVGQRVFVQVTGVANCVADGNITRGQRVIGATTSGRVLTDPKTGSSVSYTLGVATETSTQGNDIKVLLSPNAIWNA